VTDALTDFELGESHENAGTAENVRKRTADAFDGDGKPVKRGVTPESRP
jgi:hypothetical protein